MIKYKKSVATILIMVFIITSAGFASARRDGRNGNRNRNVNVHKNVNKNVNVNVNRRGNRHRNRNVHVNVNNDRYYRHGRHPVARVGMGVVAGIVIGTAIATLPPRHNTIVVQNTTYIVSDGVYYQMAPAGGYIVVQAPLGY